MVLEEERLWTEENIDTVDQKVREEREEERGTLMKRWSIEAGGRERDWLILMDGMDSVW